MFVEKLKKLDIVMTVAWILAIVSTLIVRIDKKYIDYIDFRSLAILWGLMIVIQGFRKNGLFDLIAGKLIKRFNKNWQLIAVLVYICFVFSMFITNDVALITFVPMTLMILKEAGKEEVLIPVIVLETIAANLGSMLTAIGNPQNLYLYGLTGLNLLEFSKIILPYSLASAILLLFAILFVNKGWHNLNKSEKPVDKNPINKNKVDNYSKTVGKEVIVYAILFILALLCVARIIPYYYFAGIVFISLLIYDWQMLKKADYVLLLTFIAFFIFTGNMARIGFINDFLEKIIASRECIISVITSQFISNVPATLMLTKFTSNYKELLIGVNIGGLGSLIASMASLISYKAYTKEYKENTGKYIKAFTAYNILFLIALLILYLIIH